MSKKFLAPAPALVITSLETKNPRLHHQPTNTPQNHCVGGLALALQPLGFTSYSTPTPFPTEFFGNTLGDAQPSIFEMAIARQRRRRNAKAAQRVSYQ